MHATAVACLSGQVRTFARTAGSIAKLLNAMDLDDGNRSESVAFINQQDSGKGGTIRHAVDEFLPALHRLRAKYWELYDTGSYRAVEIAARASCWSEEPGHWSHHFAQMWVVATSLNHVLEREVACDQRYKLVVRGRPDMTLGDTVLRAVRRIVGMPAAVLDKPAAWMTTGIGADRFLVLTRAAVAVLAHGLLHTFRPDACGTSKAQNWRPDARACSRGRVPTHGTECLMITVLTRGGAAVHFDKNLRVGLERLPVVPGGGRRLSEVAIDHSLNGSFASRKRAAVAVTGQDTRSSGRSCGEATIRHDTRLAVTCTQKLKMGQCPTWGCDYTCNDCKGATGNGGRPLRQGARSAVPQRAGPALPRLAILCCGQMRTLELVVSNLVSALAHLRNDSDLLVAIDRRVTAGPKKAMATAEKGLVQEVVQRLDPRASSVAEKSKGQDDSLIRAHLLMQNLERERGERYTWVMRLRPDMAYMRAFPPLSAWPKPVRPTLFADYLGSGENGSSCGSTDRIDPSMLRDHGACADDNFGYMSRSAADAYFRHWFWHASCGGTSRLPSYRVRPSGIDGRLGCIECRLGCAMHVAKVELAAIPGIRVHRMLVRHGHGHAKAEVSAELPNPMPMLAVAYDPESGLRHPWTRSS